MNGKEERLCEELYLKYNKKLYWYIRKRGKDISEDDIGDIMQNIWCEVSKFITKLSVMGEDERFYWLLCVSHSKCMDYYRKAKRNRVLNEKVREDHEVAFGKEVWEELSTRLDLQEVLADLSPSERKLVYDVYIGNSADLTDHKLTNAECCKLYRIRKRLRKKFRNNKR